MVLLKLSMAELHGGGEGDEGLQGGIVYPIFICLYRISRTYARVWALLTSCWSQCREFRDTNYC